MGNIELEVKVQETLDELLDERLIPFALTAYRVEAEGLGEYLISFHESRIRSCSFSWEGGEDLKEVVRAAVLECVRKMSASYEEYRRSRERYQGSYCLTPRIISSDSRHAR